MEDSGVEKRFFEVRETFPEANDARSLTIDEFIGLPEDDAKALLSSITSLPNKGFLNTLRKQRTFQGTFVSLTMADVIIEISVGGDVFKCPASWTVAKVKKNIRDQFLISGGGLKRDGIAVDDEDPLVTTGTYSFMGGFSSVKAPAAPAVPPPPPPQVNWNSMEGSLVRIQNALGSFQGVVVSPHFVMTSFHGNNDTVTEYNAILSSGESKIITLHIQVFEPNKVDIALFRLRGDQSNFVLWMRLADRLPALSQEICAVSFIPGLDGNYIFSAQRSSIIAYQTDNVIAFAQYYAMDGFSGSGILTTFPISETIQLLGVHCGCHDDTLAVPSIDKKKGGAADAKSVSDASTHLSNQLHGHTAYCFLTVAINVHAIIDAINADLMQI